MSLLSLVLKALPRQQPGLGLDPARSRQMCVEAQCSSVAVTSQPGLNKELRQSSVCVCKALPLLALSSLPFSCTALIQQGPHSLWGLNGATSLWLSDGTGRPGPPSDSYACPGGTSHLCSQQQSTTRSQTEDQASVNTQSHTWTAEKWSVSTSSHPSASVLPRSGKVFLKPTRQSQHSAVFSEVAPT